MTERWVAGGFPRLEVELGAPLAAGITGRELDFGGATDTPARSVGAARAALREWARGRFHGVVGGSQVHGSRLWATDGTAVAGDDGAGGPWALRLAGYDGFMTAEPGILLTVSVADCVPALLWAPDAGAVALVHAGWRGVAGGIVPRAVEALAGRYGARPGSLHAWWGPAIGPCCYEVGDEVVAAISATAAGEEPGAWVRRDGPRPRVDLRAALGLQARAAGLAPGRVAASALCTACEADRLHSYRRASGGGGRMLAFAGVPVAPS